MSQQRPFGIVGLGKMGASLALQALEAGMQVVGFVLHGPPEKLKEAGLVTAAALSELREKLAAPRIIILYVPAGPTVDHVLDDLAEV